MSEEDRADIARTLAEKITPVGIGDFSYGQPMREVALSQNDSTAKSYGIGLRKGLRIPGKDIPRTQSYYQPIWITAASDCEVGREYWVKRRGASGSWAYECIHRWNPESKLKAFVISMRNIPTDCLYPLLNDIVEEFIRHNYREDYREVNNTKTAITLSKNDFNILITDNGTDMIYILCGYDINRLEIYEDLRESFLSSQTGIRLDVYAL